jgi:hypothetical protein
MAVAQADASVTRQVSGAVALSLDFIWQSIEATFNSGNDLSGAAGWGGFGSWDTR